MSLKPHIIAIKRVMRINLGTAVDEHLILIEVDLSPSGYSQSCSFSSIPHFDHCILAKNALQFGKTVKQ